MDSKKLAVKRIILFYVIAFLPLAIMTPILCQVYGEPVFVSEKEKVVAIVQAFGIFGMFVPTIANLLTRWITKEGMENAYLALNVKGNLNKMSNEVPLVQNDILRKKLEAGGNMKYYVASVGIIILEAVIGVLLIWKIFLVIFRLEKCFRKRV
ncbi:MAG: hypothetical protein HDT39_11275 [Lachnospiraceae bacterium]|nr:hypothetical protein [Lachnospiraceae bacterium]